MGGASEPPGASTIENALLTSEWTDLVQLSVYINTSAPSTVSVKHNGKQWEAYVLPATLLGATVEFRWIYTARLYQLLRVCSTE